MHKKDKVNIIIADDHQMFLDGLCSLLERNHKINIIDIAHNGNEVLRLLKHNKMVDLVISDISMPNMDGIELTKIIKKRFPKIFVIALSMYKQSQYINKLIKSGVDGYLLKNADIEELEVAILKVAKGEKYFSKEVMEEYMNSIFSPLSIKKSQAKLSKRELQVIELIAKEFTNSQIADKLCISTYTVDTHRKNIMQKIQAKNTAGIVKYAIQHGFI